MLMLSDAAIELASRHLAASIREVEEEAKDGRLNTSCIRALANAAAVLGHNDVAERALRLIRAAPDSAFWAGMITNFNLPKTVPEGLRTIEPPDQLEQHHPLYSEKEIVDRVRSYAKTEEHFAICLEGRFQEARALAGSGVRLEEVGDTLAVLGEFDAARSVASDPALEPFRQRGVLFVLVIELFRHGRVEEAGALLADLESAGLGAWERVHLALGFAGREPWGGYPYPDW
jgi:hypothetical protein